MESVNRNRDVVTFYYGILVGIIGNFLVSSVIETSKAIFDNAEPKITIFWSIMIMFSSTALFQSLKNGLKFLEFRFNMRMFDLANVISVIIALLPIIFALI